MTEAAADADPWVLTFRSLRSIGTRMCLNIEFPMVRLGSDLDHDAVPRYARSARWPGRRVLAHGACHPSPRRPPMTSPGSSTPFTRILAAVDGSDHGLNAARTA